MDRDEFAKLYAEFADMVAKFVDEHKVTKIEMIAFLEILKFRLHLATLKED